MMGLTPLGVLLQALLLFAAAHDISAVDAHGQACETTPLLQVRALDDALNEGTVNLQTERKASNARKFQQLVQETLRDLMNESAVDGSLEEALAARASGSIFQELELLPDDEQKELSASLVSSPELAAQFERVPLAKRAQLLQLMTGETTGFGLHIIASLYSAVEYAWQWLLRCRREPLADPTQANKVVGVPKEEFGTITALYTFGAPGSAEKPGLQNLQRKDGCFPGLRTFNEHWEGGWISAKVDFGSAFNLWWHARQSILALNEEGKDSEYHPCPEDVRTDLPRLFGSIPSLNLHRHHSYERLHKTQLDGVDVSQQEPFRTAIGFRALASSGYWNNSVLKDRLREALPEWRVVARVDNGIRQDFMDVPQNLKMAKNLVKDQDPLTIIQHEKTLACALKFTGVNSLKDIKESFIMCGHLIPAPFCGWAKVHGGYRKELLDTMNWALPRLRPHLAKCSEVTCVGHSMGGSLCEMFSACVNSKRVDNPSFQKLHWRRGTPELMPELEI